MTGRRLGWVAAALVLLVLIYAYIDGGEQPIRPMMEPVELPEQAA